MIDDIETLAVGVAAVIDTVLLLAMFEQRNWKYVTLWMVLMMLGAWLWHSGQFIHILLKGGTGIWSLRLHWCSMSVMSAGLLLMPCAMWHGAWRLRTTALSEVVRSDWRYAGCYLPLLVLIPAVTLLGNNPGGEYLELLSPFVWPYVLWVSVVNVLSALILLRKRQTIDQPRAMQCFGWMAATLIGMTVAMAFVELYARDVWPESTDWLQLSITLLPTVPVLLFAYFVIRYRFLSLILERTLVYGGIVVGLLLLHRVLSRDLAAVVQERYQVDFGIVEGVAGLTLILAYQPLRQRTSEALRYLMGRRVSTVRGRMQRLSIELSEVSDRGPIELFRHAVAALSDVLNVDYVAGWLFDSTGHVHAHAGQVGRLTDERARAVFAALRNHHLRYATRADAPERQVLADIQQSDATVAVVVGHSGLTGLLLLGRQPFNQQLNEEELSALVLLAEQLGSTLNNRRLQNERLDAERRALLNEKLSTLGLLAGSIAHEIKNPLSSIKTITAVMAERLGPDSEYAEDLQLVLGEIDRLADSTGQLLEFARPRNAHGGVPLTKLLRSTVAVMRHSARQQGVELLADVDDALPVLQADGSIIQEVFYNLLSNAIEAARPGDRVTLTCRVVQNCVVASIADTGAGISAEQQDRLFEPFFTTKDSGTGLGLYIVGRHVRELGGEIHCTSSHEAGTTFTVKIPVDGRGADQSDA